MEQMDKNGKGLDYYSLKGKVVQFTPVSEVEYEIYADEGMLARVVDVQDDSHGSDKMVKITVDFNDFFDYNKRLQKPNFYDNDGNANQTWYESGLYKNGLDTIICMTDTTQHLPPFVPIDHVPITVDECLDVLKMIHEAGNYLMIACEKDRTLPLEERWHDPEFQKSFSEADKKARGLLAKAKRI